MVLSRLRRKSSRRQSGEKPRIGLNLTPAIQERRGIRLRASLTLQHSRENGRTILAKKQNVVWRCMIDDLINGALHCQFYKLAYKQKKWLEKRFIQGWKKEERENKKDWDSLFEYEWLTIDTLHSKMNSILTRKVKGIDLSLENWPSRIDQQRVLKRLRKPNREELKESCKELAEGLSDGMIDIEDTVTEPNNGRRKLRRYDNSTAVGRLRTTQAMKKLAPTLRREFNEILNDQKEDRKMLEKEQIVQRAQNEIALEDANASMKFYLKGMME